MSQPLCRSLLQAWGWEMPTEKEARKLTSDRNINKSIVVISHTSYWDFALLMMYRQADPRIKKNLHLVVKPQAFEHWGWFLRSMGCIPATRAEDDGSGFVDKTAQQFEGRDLKLIMSPEGKLEASKWRSGYYHLAKKLKASILVAGLDYKKKRLHIGKVFSRGYINEVSKEQLEHELMGEMSQIVPLYPNGSYVRVKPAHNPSQLSPVQTVPFILTVMVGFIIIVGLIVAITTTVKKTQK